MLSVKFTTGAALSSWNTGKLLRFQIVVESGMNSAVSYQSAASDHGIVDDKDLFAVFRSSAGGTLDGAYGGRASVGGRDSESGLSHQRDTKRKLGAARYRPLRPG